MSGPIVPTTEAPPATTSPVATSTSIASSLTGDSETARSVDIIQRADTVALNDEFFDRAVDAGYEDSLSTTMRATTPVLPGLWLFADITGVDARTELENKLVPAFQRSVADVNYEDGVHCWIDPANLLSSDIADAYYEQLVSTLEDQPSSGNIGLWPVDPVSIGDRSYVVDRVLYGARKDHPADVVWQRQALVVAAGTIHNLGCSIEVGPTSQIAVGTPPDELDSGRMTEVFSYLLEQYDADVLSAAD